MSLKSLDIIDETFARYLSRQCEEVLSREGPGVHRLVLVQLIVILAESYKGGPREELLAIADLLREVKL